MGIVFSLSAMPCTALQCCMSGLIKLTPSCLSRVTVGGSIGSAVPVGDGVLDEVPAWRSRVLTFTVSAQDLVAMFQRQVFGGEACAGLVRGFCWMLADARG